MNTAHSGRVMKACMAILLCAVMYFGFITHSSLTAAPAATRVVAPARSKQLTVQARKALERHDFREAYRLAGEAVKLDPANEEAKDLFVSLYELTIDPRKRVFDGPPDKRIPRTAAGAVARIGKAEGPAAGSGAAYARFSLMYSMGESDFLGYLDSSVALIGARIEGGYFFPWSAGMAGISGDYAGYPFKVRGDSRIDFMVHRVNASLVGRSRFFEYEGRFLALGLRAGYHYFLLQNKKSEGAYYFRRLNGPLIGFFFSDPVFSRFLHDEAVKPAGIEGGVNVVPVSASGGMAWVFEYNAALTYDYKALRFALGLRSYRIDNGDVRESFSDIELSAARYF